jgi:hypothetical protein
MSEENNSIIDQIKAYTQNMVEEGEQAAFKKLDEMHGITSGLVKTTPIKNGVHDLLTDVARIENDPVLQKLISTRARLEDTIAELTQHIDGMIEPANELRRELKAQCKEVVDAGGTVDHALVTVKRKKKWVYDRDAAANWAEEFEPQAVKISLKVREFEKLLPLQMDDTVRFDIEQVEETVIALPKDLSHLLISDTD